MSQGEIIEQIGDLSYPVGLVIRMGILGVTSVQLGTNTMAALGEATHGPAMTVLPLTSEYETALYYESGPLARAGTIAFAQGLPAGYFIRILGDGYTAASKYLHDGEVTTNVETFYGDGSEGPYQLEYHCYTENASNSVTIGQTDYDIVYDSDSLVTGKVYIDREAGTVKFYTGEGPEDDDLVSCSLEHYGVLGRAKSPNDGTTGNSSYMDITNGTFPGQGAQAFKGDGSVGPYYLRFNDIIEDVDNLVTVAGTEKTIVYSSGGLAAGKVYVNKTKGSLTFFAGEEPEEPDSIEVKYLYRSRCIQIHDGDAVEPALDSLVDLADIQAALIYNKYVTFVPDAYATHLPATGRYQLSGGDDGGAISAATYGKGMDVLMQYLEDNLVNVTTVAFCDYEVAAGTYDLFPVLQGKLQEMKKKFYPAIGFIGMKPGEDPDVAGKIARNYANYEFVIVVNPWDTAQPERMNMAVARAAQEATAPLGTSCARRVSNMSLQGMAKDGLLNYYRNETIRNLHNNRLDVLVKTRAGNFTFYGRNTAQEDQYRECVDVRTMNYMIWVIKYYTDLVYFAKNTPSVRATFREDLANVLDRLVADEVMDAYTLTVSSGREEGNKGLMRARLEAENVGHIKQVIVDYYNGIIPGAVVA